MPALSSMGVGSEGGEYERRGEHERREHERLGRMDDRRGITQFGENRCYDTVNAYIVFPSGGDAECSINRTRLSV